MSNGCGRRRKPSGRPVHGRVASGVHRVAAEDDRRGALTPGVRRGDPASYGSDSLTQALRPAPGRNISEWNGQTLRIVGYPNANIDMAAAIRGSGALPPIPGSDVAPDTGPTPFIPFGLTPTPGRSHDHEGADRRASVRLVALGGWCSRWD